MNIEIRPATESDLDAIVQLLERDRIVLVPGASDSVRAFREIAAHPDNELVVATVDGVVAGTLQLTFIPGMGWEWRAQVESVRVRDDLRNLKIGTRLMEWVVERARERGCKLVQLTTNATRKDAQRFYQRLGFQASHVGMKLYL